MFIFLTLVNLLIFSVTLLLAIVFLADAFRERARRALFAGIFVFAPLLKVLLFLTVFGYMSKQPLPAILPLFFVLIVAVLVLPVSKPIKLSVSSKQQQTDERDGIFHRFYVLKPGMVEFEKYYKAHPEKESIDNNIRAIPDLAQPGSHSFDPITSPFMAAQNSVLNNISRELEWHPEPLEKKVVTSEEEITARIKGFSEYLGANIVGTTVLNQAYIYSNIGRSPGKWGSRIELNHKFAIVIACEMNYKMMNQAPQSAVTTESVRAYFEVSRIAMIIAKYINMLGYEARAHVDGNYRVMCVPIAADAGLGELGRLGLLITPQYGPRVRLSVVTTNLPLLNDGHKPFGVQEFCTICKKCSHNCPSGAIDKGEKADYRGTEKWITNQEKCYQYWRICGSDCGVCINVCPYSHPTSLSHNIVRWAIKRNNLTRKFALFGDDVIYGRKAETVSKLPDWHLPSKEI